VIPTLQVTAPTLEYGILAPLLILMAAACVSVLVEAFVPRGSRRPIQIGLTLVALLAALAGTLNSWSGARYQLAAQQTLSLDAPSYATWALLLIFSIGVVALFAERTGGAETAFVASASTVPGSAGERRAIADHQEQTEVYPLMLFAVFGMMMFSASNELIVMFVALEIFSLPLYLLCGLGRRRRLISQEAALKYFLLGALSSAVFLYGTALLYGASGSFELASIDAALTAQPGSSRVAVAGMALVAVGLLFKIGAVPFHTWVPDVYTGAPSPVTAFMSVATKIAGVVGMMRVLYVGLGALRWDWQPLLAVLAVATMGVGCLVGLVQSDIKRLLAYSSIAHAGFMMVAIAGAYTVQTGMAQGFSGSFSSVMVYMVGYGLATIGMFVIVMMVRKAGGESNEIASWAGLGRRYPLAGGAGDGVHAELRRNPADLRLRRQAAGADRRLARRLGLAVPAGRAVQRGRRLLLPARGGGGVLPGSRRGRRGGRGVPDQHRVVDHAGGVRHRRGGLRDLPAAPDERLRPRQHLPAVGRVGRSNGRVVGRSSTCGRSRRPPVGLRAHAAHRGHPVGTGVSCRNPSPASSPISSPGSWLSSRRSWPARPGPTHPSSPRPRTTSSPPAARGSGRCWW
jgi:NADH-quinone oxidoreductase subunit N